MQGYFERIEDCRHRWIRRLLYKLLGWNPTRHGFGGWLTTNVAKPELVLGDKQLLRMMKKSAKVSLLSSYHFLRRLYLSLRARFDPNDWRILKNNEVGIRLAPLSTRRGQRVGTRELLQATQKAHPEQPHHPRRRPSDWGRVYGW
jgi:choline dehydrogenase